METALYFQIGFVTTYECIFTKYDSISSCASIIIHMIDSQYSFEWMHICTNTYSYRYVPSTYNVYVSEKLNPVIWVNLIITFQAICPHVNMYDILSMTNLHAKYWEIKLSLEILLHMVHEYNKHMFAFAWICFLLIFLCSIMTFAICITKYWFLGETGFTSNLIRYIFNKYYRILVRRLHNNSNTNNNH